MYKAVHIDQKGKLLVDHTQYLRKHDIIYKTPAYEGFDGMPLGNGDMGGMLFNTKDSLKLVINKTDTFDDRAPGDFGAWAWEEEEKNSALVSCGVLTISDTLPSFDQLYLNNFEQRMNLAEANINVETTTPFSEYKIRSFASRKYNIIVMEIETSAIEEVERTVSLARWGSRNFFHYYSTVLENPGLKLNGTQAGEKDGSIYIKQKLSEINFVVACKFLNCSGDVKIRNSHQADLVMPPARNAIFKVLITTVQGSEMESLVDNAIQILRNAQDNYSSIFSEHQEAWRNFWKKSFIKIQDDYLENLYYFNLYQLNSSCTGGFPPLFTGSIWTWNHDVRNWGHFYHWNNQPQYWSMHTSNHHELAKNYFDYRFMMLDNAKRNAMDIFGVDGAWYSDISNRKGYQAVEPDTRMNLTVGPQIAMDFYRHYCYTLDVEFLRDKAYPVMNSCANLYCGLLKKGADSRYHLSATAYESYWCICDTATDFSAIKALFKALIDTIVLLGTENDKIDFYRDIYDNLYTLPVTNQNCNGDIIETVISAGRKVDGSSVRYEEGKYPESPFGASELAPVFPSGIIGLKDSGSELFEIARNTLLRRGLFNCSGHTPHPVVAARLGMAEELAAILDYFINSFQCFPSGLCHFGNVWDSYYSREHTYNPQALTGDESHTDWEIVHENSDRRRVRYSCQDFIHMYAEALSNIAVGVNEMLLQSYDGVIRVFPAVKDEGDNMFNLIAEGGFAVTSEKKGATTKYIFVHSQYGGLCRIYCPWQEEIVVQKNGKLQNDLIIHDNIIFLETQKDDTLLLYPKAYPLTVCYESFISANSNNGVKKKSKARLGKE